MKEDKGNTGIPNFSIVGPKKDGIVDQFLTIGWKWYALGDLYCEALQLFGRTCEEMNGYIDGFRQFGQKWNRRAIESKAHHLWSTVWRLKGEIGALEREIQGMRDYWKPIPKNLGFFRRIMWRIIFGETYERPWDLDG